MKKIIKKIIMCGLMVVFSNSLVMANTDSGRIYESKMKELNSEENMIVPFYDFKDFNGDGIEDMYVLQLEKRNITNGKHLIYTYKNGKVVELAEKELTSNKGVNGHHVIGLDSTDMNERRIREVYVEEYDDKTISTAKRYALQNNEMVEVNKIRQVISNGKVISLQCWINGKEYNLKENKYLLEEIADCYVSELYIDTKDILINTGTSNNLEEIYSNKVKEIESLGNKKVTGHYIAEIDGNHDYPELIVAATEYNNNGFGIQTEYPFYIFTIQDGKIVELKNETNITSGDDMGTQTKRNIVTNKNGDSLIKEVTVEEPFLDVDYNNKRKTYVATNVKYLKYVPDKGLTRYLEKESYMIYDNDKFDTSGKGTYKLVYVGCNDEEIKESKYEKLASEYK